MKFPEDYKSFLLQTNGGTPEHNAFTVAGKGDGLVGIFFGIQSERTSCDLEYEQEEVAMWDPLPLGVIAIGVDPGGCYLLLQTQGVDAGVVYFWDRSGLWVKEDGFNTFFCAPSFSAFLMSLWQL